MSDLEETWFGYSFYSQNFMQNIFNTSSFNNNWTPETCLSDWTSGICIDIFTAASIGDYSSVNTLISNQMSLTKATNKFHWNALMFAVYYNREDIITLLLDKGAPLHACNEIGQNVLMLAAKAGRDFLMEQFLNCGSHIESRCAMDWTPLIYAVYFDNLEAAQVLLKHRANPNALVRTSGETALMFAARNGSIHMVELLMNAGAFPNFKCISGKDAFNYAIESGHDNIASLLNRRKSKGEISLLEGPNFMDTKMMLPYQRKRNYSEPETTCTTYASDLDCLLLQFNLDSFIPHFKQHEVDLLIFLSLSDKDLKDCGVMQLGPRRKMLDAISRWHNAPSRKGFEYVYELKLQNQIRELEEQLSEYKQNRLELESQKQDIKNKLQECQSRCYVLRDLLSKVFQSISIGGSLQKISEMFVGSFEYIDDFIRFTDTGGGGGLSSRNRNNTL